MTDGAPRAPRRVRSATESLLAIALGLEACLVFFVTLTVYGLRVLDPVAAFVGGGALLVLLVLTTRLVRYPWGVGLGWLLQVVLIATGILVPIMYVIGAGFAAIWVFCFIKGRSLDRAKAAVTSQGSTS
ncbi:DUF4233 domain-containing protein [Antiquaquibacter oligotrophicus]|uniref:DUF4233 domain-containing protein n=1 Tax=Antiquaquibacter oligotrophicus TaxID=2880260 RepID=UPI002AC92A7B|nr:DUF4233 domain-containing protein [Antiquaquibacter oligotrophicus]UDF13079.1 DUF4233 domain-containing protein [Antiquaquibacter oligotrophicus]